MTEDKLVVVFTSCDPAETERASALLREHGIEPVVSGLSSPAAIGAASLLYSARISVAASQATQARELIAGTLPDAERASTALVVAAGSDVLEAGAVDRPEDDREAAEPSAERFHDPVWIPVFGLTVLQLALLVLVGDDPDHQRLFAFGALNGWPGAGGMYRLVTFNFLHFSLGHLLSNTMTLVPFAWAAIRLFGLGRTAFT